MTFEDDLQRSFDSARPAVDLEPGSLESVKRRAEKRIRNAWLGAGAVAAVAIAAGGWLLLPDAEPIEVATEGWPAPAADVEEPAVTTEPMIVDVDDDNESSAESDADEQDGIADDVEVARPTEDNFAYLGSFLVPAGDFGNSRFAYGGEVSAFNPAGDPDSSDGFAGSLFMSGHPRRNPGVAEITIPEPAPHSGVSDGLPVASVLQPFADITAGRGDDFVASEAVGGSGEYRYGGLEVLDGPGGPRLHWSIWQYINVSDNTVPGHGHSSLDLDAPDPQGPWFLGDGKNLQTAGYLLAVPDEFADRYLGGRSLLAGHKDTATGASGSWGPPFFAYEPPVEAEPNAVVDAVNLASYLNGRQLPDYGQADVARGAAWISTSDGAEAVVTVGRRGLGEVRNGVPEEGDCSPYAGVHADPYEPQVLFYDPADLAAAAQGNIEPHQLEPYRRWNPAEHLIPNCAWFLSSISFDAQTNRVYIVQAESDLSQDRFSPVPVVHVFQL